MLLDFIWGMGAACHLEGQSRVFCTPRSTWYEVRSQNPAICQGEFKELKSGCVLVFHISIKYVYKMPGSPKCLMNQGALKGLSLLAAAGVTGSGHPVCLGRVRDTCEPVYSTDRGCSPSRPSGAAGNQSILPGLLSQPGAGHWCSTDSWNAGAARWGAGSELSLPTSECVWQMCSHVYHTTHIHMVHMGWHSLLQERCGSGLSRAGGSFGAPTLQGGSQPCCPVHLHELLKPSLTQNSFPSWNQNRTHTQEITQKACSRKLGLYSGTDWRRMWKCTDVMKERSWIGQEAEMWA